MRYKKLVWAGVVLAVVTAGFFRPAGAETCNRVVAIVNDDVITLYELNKKIKQVTGFSPADLRSRDEEGFLEARRRVLDLLINEKISQKKIAELGIRVTQKQVDRAIERVKELNHWTQEDLMRQLEKDGLTYEQYAARMKTNLERMKLIDYEVKSKIIIREEMVRDYYKKHLEDFMSDQEVHLAGIFLARKNPGDQEEMKALIRKGREILDELRRGKDFQALAREISEGPTAGDGGDLGTFKMSHLGPEIRKALRSVPVGGVSDIIVQPGGIQIIKVLSRKGGKQKSFEEVRDAIYETLYQMEVNRRYISWIKKLREKSYTKIIF
ncbi:MAG: SurA N-terminal domain-containing protein [Deltaproteobacteria bacterium]|nr:SurA N-terminal domain-containing protein [Deltaproteobacteria bacterium]MBW2017922.1 SurA N-terminal domain-containing protein [Deltaproteobacteria bacterium]